MIQTKAFQLVRNGTASEAFSLNEISLAAPKNDEVVIDVTAFGLNYADIMARRGLYKECPPLPTVIGYEVVGVVSKVGGDQQDLLGKRVVAFTRFGGYSQKVITKATGVAEIGTLDTGKALCLATQYVTAYYMSHYVISVREGERILIHAAAGGVGTALIQLVKHCGGEVYAKVGNDSKIDYLKQLGVHKVVNYRKADYEDQLKELLQGECLDVSFNPSGGSTFKKDLKLLGTGGRLVLFGGSERSGKKWGILSTLNFVRKMGLIIPITLMMSSKNVMGVNMLKIGDYKPEVLTHCLRQVVQMTLEGTLDPKVGGTFNAADFVKAQELLESGTSTGKVVVFWDK